MKTLFLSSTARDLKDYRDEVYNKVSGLDGYKCIRMEEFGTRDQRDWETADFCSTQVKQCDLMIGILGLLYGSAPQNTDRSFTEVEFEAAVEGGLSIMMFVSPDNFAVPGDLRESDELWARQQAFRRRVKEKGIVSMFLSPQDLAARVIQAITNKESEDAKRALTVFQDLMEQPQILEAAISSRARLEVVRERLDGLARYKDIHDQLHKLQFMCYDMLVQEARHFPEESSNLEMHEITLGEIIGALREMTSDPAMPSPDRAWIDDLESARASLALAIKSQDAPRLTTVIWSLNRILTVQPSKINTALNRAARELGLEQVVNAMAAVRKPALAGKARISPNDLQAFDEGREALARLNARLIASANSHDRWQQLEDEARRIENAIRSDLEELENSWPILRPMAEPLYSDDQRLAEDAQKLDGLLSAGLKLDGPVRAAFRAYRRRVGTGFDKVDRELKHLCDDLRRVGDALTAVLGSMR